MKNIISNVRSRGFIEIEGTSLNLKGPAAADPGDGLSERAVKPSCIEVASLLNLIERYDSALTCQLAHNVTSILDWEKLILAAVYNVQRQRPVCLHSQRRRPGGHGNGSAEFELIATGYVPGSNSPDAVTCDQNGFRVN